MPRFSSFRPALSLLTAALLGVLSTQPAAAQDAAGAAYAHKDWQDPRPDTPTASPPVSVPLPVSTESIPGRAQWLAECRRRVADRDDWQREWRRDRKRGHGHASRGPDECESYLDDYYANARAHHAHQMQAWSGQPMQVIHGHAAGPGGHGGACCQAAPVMAAPSGPYMLVPVMLPARKANCEREVIETVEEIVPARRVIPRRAPPRDKRIRIAPDKRVRTQ
jgi:hypothetical protein